MITWRIRESSHGGYVAEKIGIPEKGIKAGFKAGVIVGAVLYESAHFDTRNQAEKYIKEH